MESDVEKKVEWRTLQGGAEVYRVSMNQAMEGGVLISSVRKLIENIPTYAVECLKCAKLHRFANLLKGCPNCSSNNYAFGGSPSQVSIICARCGNEILQSVTCECGCVNLLNGRTLREPKTGGCFIATATYGSPLAPEVIHFRHFRDSVLLNSKTGKVFIAIYYIASPALAFLISRNYLLRMFTRRFLLQPLLRILKKRKESAHGCTNNRNSSIR